MGLHVSQWAIVAFLVEFCTRSLAQYGFLLQKQAHRDLEKKKLINNINSDDEKEDIDLDKVNASKTYCSVKWVIGFILITMNVCCHGLVLPFVDLTLLACNAATAIIVNMLLSTYILGEKFIWKYDLTAMLLIASGSIIIATQAHTDQVNFTPQEIHDLLVKADTIIYLFICIALFLGEGPMLKYFYRRLREFEADALSYEEAHMRHSVISDNEKTSNLIADRRDHECQEDSTTWNSILPPLPDINQLNQVVSTK